VSAALPPVNLAEYEAHARTILPPMVWDYYAGGADDELTLRDNCAAYGRVKLLPRALVDVSRIELGTTVLGARVAAPVLVPPLAYQRLAHDDGERATARGAAAAGTLMVVSTMSTTRLEDVAAAAPEAPRWFQLYVYKDRGVSADLVRRAEAAGYRALVLTVDTPRLGRRERDVRNGFGLPPHLSVANFDGTLASKPAGVPGVSGLAAYGAAHLDDSLGWDKGVMTDADARLALAHGAAAIGVSNHGGRQLDGVPASLDVLAEIVDAVAGACEVYVDGGVRRGTDVVKALARGARAVLVGRPILWGLASAGAAGVERVLTLLCEELEHALALVGCPSVHALDRSFLRP
jgi:4-hydroxymandelate oxidase